MPFGTSNSFASLSDLTVEGAKYRYFSLQIAAEKIGLDLHRLPFSLRVLLENLLRFEDGKAVTKQDIEAIAKWLQSKTSQHEISYYPARVLMQDFTGVPAVVDLATMRDASKELGGDVKAINPLIPVDLVIDHSVQVDKYASNSALKDNVDLEMQRNNERYQFLKWGQEAFKNFSVVPPGTGICHQVNLEYLAKVIWEHNVDGQSFIYPDTVVGTDSHTTMINGLSVLGWGVGGIEAEAVMLGEPTSMVIPEVVGFKLYGKLPQGTTATDLVLTVTEMLRKKGVVNKFVEFYGSGVASLSVANRATIANMAPEYGATCGFFPIDQQTLDYMALSGRSAEWIKVVEAYAKAQHMWRVDDGDSIVFTDVLELDLSTVEPSLAGPKRPQDRVLLSDVATSFAEELPGLNKNPNNMGQSVSVAGADYQLKNGDVVIAAITSCTNTSNPYVMMGAGLLARNARKKGLRVKPWVKTSLAPGSQVVSAYLEQAGLQSDLDALGFQVVGYGCTTCIGNSGPLQEVIEKTIADNNLVVASVLSGNRNFEGRVHSLVRANYLASPMLCVAYAIAGSVEINLQTEPLGQDKSGHDVYLKDIWPSTEEIEQVVHSVITPNMFREKYQSVFKGDASWQALPQTKGDTYAWQQNSTYIQKPPYFVGLAEHKQIFPTVVGAKVLAIFGDSITTDHISPAGSIAKDSPAAKYLNAQGIANKDFNSYGARRGNHEVMMRGTFANVRIKNEMVPGKEGGYTMYQKEVVTIYDAAMKYIKAGVPTVIIAGKEYGTGSSRDWAAKGPNLLGVKMVIAESFERIHRSNLVGMGIIPLQFVNGMSRHDLDLSGDEEFSLSLPDVIKPQMEVKCLIKGQNGEKTISLKLRVDTEVEVDYMKNGGILHAVLRKLIKS